MEREERKPHTIALVIRAKEARSIISNSPFFHAHVTLLAKCSKYSQLQPAPPKPSTLSNPDELAIDAAVAGVTALNVRSIFYSTCLPLLYKQLPSCRGPTD